MTTTSPTTIHPATGTRPRLAPKAVLRRVGGAAASLAVLASVGLATAPVEASTSVWDRVAACESSGNWSINTGNGYYGGLQFSASTWRAYGGGAYASTANRASKAQQIAIARRVLAGQGPGAWPVCGRRAGLTRSNGGADAHATAGGSSSTTTTTRATSPTRTTTSGHTVRVRSGDTLGKIAARYHVRGGWRGLWALNKRTVHNPNLIYVGEVLRIS